MVSHPLRRIFSGVPRYIEFLELPACVGRRGRTYREGCEGQIRVVWIYGHKRMHFQIIDVAESQQEEYLDGLEALYIRPRT